MRASIGSWYYFDNELSIRLSFYISLIISRSGEWINELLIIVIFKSTYFLIVYDDFIKLFVIFFFTISKTCYMLCLGLYQFSRPLKPRRIFNTL